MSEREQTADAGHEGDHDDQESAAQHAARHDAGGEEEHTPQDGTDNTSFDTDQHSDAPGPFGTG